MATRSWGTRASPAAGLQTGRTLTARRVMPEMPRCADAGALKLSLHGTCALLSGSRRAPAERALIRSTTPRRGVSLTWQPCAARLRSTTCRSTARRRRQVRRRRLGPRQLACARARATALPPRTLPMNTRCYPAPARWGCMQDDAATPSRPHRWDAVCSAGRESQQLIGCLQRCGMRRNTHERTRAENSTEKTLL